MPYTFPASRQAAIGTTVAEAALRSARRDYAFGIRWESMPSGSQNVVSSGLADIVDANFDSLLASILSDVVP